MIPTYDFMTALKFVSHAMGVNDVRYYINGVLFRFTETTLTMVATDGHRVAQVRLTHSGGPLTGDHIVKAESVKAALSTVKPKLSDASQVTLTNAPDGSDSLLMTAGAFMLVLSVQDGNYPDTNRATPSRDPEGAATIGVSIAYLQQAAAALKPMASRKHGGVILDSWTPGEAMRLRTGPTLSAQDSEAEVYIMPMRL